MKINGISGSNAQMGQMGMNQATDSYSRNIQSQIANAQKQLQELSSNEEMTLEEKMKKRQEIQQQISDLNMQLRQHQAEQRKEKQQAKASSMDDMIGGTKSKAGEKGIGMSQASMTAMISADTSIKQAKVQGSVATSMEGRAGVLESEIKNNHGADVTKKKEELADVTQKAQAATASQMNTLAETNKAMEEAAVAERGDNKTSGVKEEKTGQAENIAEKAAESGTNGEKAQNGVSGTESQTGNAENVQRDDSTQAGNVQPVETAVPEVTTAQAAVYAHVDVRL